MSTKKATAPISGTATSKPAKAHPQFTANRSRAAERLPVLDCGCADPMRCRCKNAEPSENTVAGYREAVRHLDAHGMTAAPLLPELRRLWRSGDRELVAAITAHWVVTP